MSAFKTKHLSESGQTVAKVLPEALGPDERRLIMEGSLGYCESHNNLYRKVTEEDVREGRGFGLLNCPLPDVVCKCEGITHHGPHISDFSPCKEW